MSIEVQKLEAKLQELGAARDGLLALRTREDTAQAAAAFLEAARARSEGLGGLVVGGHAVGHALDDVLRAFLLSDPRLDSWLVEEVAAFGELTEKERAGRVSKVDAQIASVTADYRKALVAQAKAEAEAKVRALEESFSGDAA